MDIEINSELNFHSVKIAKDAKNQDELAFCIKDGIFYYVTFANRAIGGKKRKRETIEKINNNDFTILKKLELKKYEIALAFNLLSFTSENKSIGFSIVKENDRTLMKEILNDLSKKYGVPIEQRHLNEKERKSAVGLYKFYIIMAVICTIFFTIYIGTAENIYSIYPPFWLLYYIGTFGTFFLFLAITLYCIYLYRVKYERTAFIVTEIVDCRKARS